MNLLLSFVFIISISISSTYDYDDIVPVDDPCEEMLDLFAYVTGNFTHCAIHNARPIRMCTKCVNEYIEVRYIYDDILKLGPDGKWKCKDKLINLDRLEIVNSGFDYVTSLWDRASCNTCFYMKDGCPTVDLKPKVVKLFNISESFEDCLKDHTNGSVITVVEPEVCTECNQYYQDLNNVYEDLRGPSGEELICMDVVDLANRTRYQWSSKLKCFVPLRQTQVIYWSITGVALALPVLFYLGAWGFITKKEQVINAQINFPGYLRHYSYHSQPSVTPAR